MDPDEADMGVRAGSTWADGTLFANDVLGRARTEGTAPARLRLRSFGFSPRECRHRI
jgi:hypothetical protein